MAARPDVGPQPGCRGRTPALSASSGPIKEECLGRIIFLGEASLRRALREYEAHYNAERPHQDIGNRVVDLPADPRSTSLRLVAGHERLGGLLRHYRASA